jgi:dephospho-CoA kinase
LQRKPAPERKPIIGITGGIGAGKTTVARMFEALGAAVVDSDLLAHEELRQPDVGEELRGWWGDAILGPDGGVSRRAIAQIVFDAPGELDRLEKLLYPRINRRREALVDGYEADPAVRAVVFDAPKLHEAGLDRLCDAIVFVDADWETRVSRVKEKRAWDEAELRRREDLQISLDSKRSNADYVLSTHSSLDRLRADVERVFSSVIASELKSGCSQGEQQT